MYKLFLQDGITASQLDASDYTLLRDNENSLSASAADAEHFSLSCCYEFNITQTSRCSWPLLGSQSDLVNTTQKSRADERASNGSNTRKGPESNEPLWFIHNGKRGRDNILYLKRTTNSATHEAGRLQEVLLHLFLCSLAAQVSRESWGTLVPALTVVLSGQHTLTTSRWRIRLQNCIFLPSMPIAAADSATIHSRTKWLQNAIRSAFSHWVRAGVNGDVRYKKTKKQAHFFLLLEKALPPETL